MLVDILAALPIEHVVRMVRLGNTRLQNTCSLKWVKDRMTDITFQEVFRAYKSGGYLADTFCTSSIIKRLNGKVMVRRLDVDNVSLLNTYVELARQVTGTLRLCIEAFYCDTVEANNWRDGFTFELCKLPNLRYASTNLTGDDYILQVIFWCPKMVFDYCYYALGGEELVHSLKYRPALLNGRHPVDVLRTVCGPADVSEAELDRVRREAMEEARGYSFEDWEGEAVWRTWWKGGAFIAS